MKITLKCDFDDFQFSRVDNRAVVSFKLKQNDYKLYDKLHEMQEKSKDGLRVEIDTWREKRSLDANAYFHLLVNKLAREMNISDTECKIALNLDYGSPAEDEFGNRIYIKLPKSVDTKDFYPYCKWIKNQTEENGYETSYYLLYKETHNLDTKEMSKLIDGVVYEAKRYGIETRTPEEIAKMKASWGSEK